jgi:hypothetical protein
MVIQRYKCSGLGQPHMGISAPKMSFNITTYSLGILIVDFVTFWKTLSSYRSRRLGPCVASWATTVSRERRFGALLVQPVSALFKAQHPAFSFRNILVFFKITLLKDSSDAAQLALASGQKSFTVHLSSKDVHRLSDEYFV